MPEVDSKAVGARLKALRGKQKQVAYARMLGIGLSTYARYERGERLPDVNTLTVLAKDGVSCDWLLTGRSEDAMEPPDHSNAGLSNTALREALRAVFATERVAMDAVTAERLSDRVAEVYRVLVDQGA